MRDYDNSYDTMTRGGYRNDFRDNEYRDRDQGGFLGFGDDNDRHSTRDYRNEERGYSSRDRDRSSFSDRSRDERRNFGPDQRREGIARDETRRLIASNKVEGTPVYGRDREQLGSIYNFMVEKRSGKVEYAVMKTSSGFLGLDERYYPLDWDELTYDTRVDGYHVHMTQDDLDRRRSFDSRGRSNESNRDDYDRESSTW